MQEIQRLNTPVGRFVQMCNDGDPLTFKAFLQAVESDFFTDNWGYERRLHGISVPGTSNTCYVGHFLCCALDRAKDAPDRYSVNSIDISELFRKIERP